MIQEEPLGEFLYPRHGTPRDLNYATFGDQVYEVSKALNIPLMDWQRHIARVALEHTLDEDGRVQFRYREVRVWVPRQSGKSSLLMAWMAWRSLGFSGTVNKPQHTKFYAANGLASKKTWTDVHVPALDDSLLKDQYDVRRSPGMEAMLFHNKSSWGIGSGSVSSGHGESLDFVTVDEYWSAIDTRLEEGLRPTLITRDSPQMVFVSTFGSNDADAVHQSVPLNEKVDDSRERCQNNEHGAVASFEYSAADFDSVDGDIDYGSREVWKSCMPSLAENNGLHNYTLDAIAAEFSSMPSHVFRRSFLNLRAPKGSLRTPSLITPVQWDAIYNDKSNFRRGSKISLGIDTERDGSQSSIVACGPNLLPGAEQHLELIATHHGSAWVADELARLCVRHDVVNIGFDGAGPAARLLADLERISKNARVPLVSYTGRKYQGACESFRLGVVDETMRHIGQGDLTDSVGQGILRETSDLWLWSRKDPKGYTSPLIAATVAHRAALDAAAVGSRASAYEDEDASVW